MALEDPETHLVVLVVLADLLVLEILALVAVLVVLADLLVLEILVAQVVMFQDNLWVLNPLDQQHLLQSEHLVHQ